MITTLATREALMQSAAARIADALCDGIATRGAGCAALSGGGTPEPAYRALAAMDLDWPKVTFALVDERFVPPAHAASNEALLRRALAPALANGATLAPMYTPGVTLDEAAARADAAYAALSFDIALMGMGDDAHTASWFAHGQGLAEALDPSSPRTIVAMVANAAAETAERLTLTRGAVARAGRAVLLITGDAKRARLGAALQQPIAEAPVGALFEAPAAPIHVLWAP